MKGKWTYETCLEEAKKYDKKTDFQTKSGGAYDAARKNGWLLDYDWFINAGASISASRTKWTYETCFEEAKKYKSRNELRKGSNGAYGVALKNGWLDDYTWFVKPPAHNKKWTRETCFEEAKKYGTRSKFQKGSHGAYEAARLNGWLSDYTWLVDGKAKLFTDKLDSVYMYQFEDGAVYVGRTLMRNQQNRHMNHQHDAVGKYAKKHNLPLPPMKIIEENLTLREGLEREDYWVNWYRDNGYNVINKAKTGIGSGSLGGISNGKWNKVSCFEEAQKYETKMEFKKGCSGAYWAAVRNRWLKDYTWFKEIQKPKGYWTYERCFEEAKKHKTITELQNGCSRAYRLALENGWFNDYTWFNETKKPKGYWTYENCLAESKKYKTISEFHLNCGSAYNVARQNGWFDEFFPNRRKKGRSRNRPLNNEKNED